MRCGQITRTTKIHTLTPYGEADHCEEEFADDEFTNLSFSYDRFRYSGDKDTEGGEEDEEEATPKAAKANSAE